MTANRGYALAGLLAGAQTSYNTQTNYWPSGAVMNYWCGNNVVPVYTYNSRLQLSHSWVTIGNSSNSYLQALNYDWGDGEQQRQSAERVAGGGGNSGAVQFAELSESELRV